MSLAAILSFLSDLEANNNKQWFDEHRSAYETAKKDFELFIADLQMRMADIEPVLAQQKAKDNIFRIFRDVRFSKDKTPYKANFGAYLSRGGKKSADAGYYLHIQPGDKSFVAAGMWMPESPILKKVRQEIDYNTEAFEQILKAPGFKKHYKKLDGERLKAVPQGFSADSPAIAYLKHKSFIVSTPLSDKEVSAKNFSTKLPELFAAAKPLVDFLNKALD